MSHPFRDVAIVGVHNTVQARRLPGHDSSSIALLAALGALDDAGIPVADVDGVVGRRPPMPCWSSAWDPAHAGPVRLGIPAIADAAVLVASGQCRVVVAWPAAPESR